MNVTSMLAEMPIVLKFAMFIQQTNVTATMETARTFGYTRNRTRMVPTYEACMLLRRFRKAPNRVVLRVKARAAPMLVTDLRTNVPRPSRPPDNIRHVWCRKRRNISIYVTRNGKSIRSNSVSC